MPNERIREENQQRVLEKAVELCAKKGLEQMSLSELAKEAHVSIRSFYRYYDSKDDLMIKVVGVAIAGLKDALSTAMKQKSYQATDGAHKVIALCQAMLHYAKDNCNLQSKLIAAEPYLGSIGVPDAFSLFDTTDNMVTQWFVSAFKSGIADGSIPPEVLTNDRSFKILAVTYRGFYSRIALISADQAMSSHYDPEQLIEDYLKQVYKTITTKP